MTFQEVDDGSFDDEARPEDGRRVDGDLAEVEALVAPPHRVDPEAVVVGRREVKDEPVLRGVGPAGGKSTDLGLGRILGSFWGTNCFSWQYGPS